MDISAMKWNEGELQGDGLPSLSEKEKRING
jgi:hypothetical protein